MTSDAVDYLMEQPGGAKYVVLYQVLCLKTINTEGRLERQIGDIVIPYSAEKIAKDCKWFSADTVKAGIALFRTLGLIYDDCNGAAVLTDYSNLVGSETDYAERNRRARERQERELPRSEQRGERGGSFSLLPSAEEMQERLRQLRKEAGNV